MLRAARVTACRARSGGRRAKKVNAFTVHEAERFVYHVLLQRFEGANMDAAMERRIIALQEELHRSWRGDVTEQAPTAQEQQQMCALLCRYCLGAVFIENAALEVVNRACRRIGLPCIDDAHATMRLLEGVGYALPGDNPHRLAHTNIELPVAAHAEVPKHLNVTCPYDTLRTTTPHNVYAIDSATTSEVDDAIGIEVDAEGREWLTVYVSDATVHCPFGSDLEALTGRALSTTTYLPEGVWFMLPREIIEAATLRSDRPCRTFELRFRIDEATAEVSDFSVRVGWARHVQRITYDAMQDLLDRGPGQTSLLSSTPGWASERDIEALHRIHHYARIRLEKRLSKPRGFQTSLPEPLVKVRDCHVESLSDQVLGTKDARVAVAELMIAANEVCARIAAEIKQPIPFRGSRPFSTTNEAALEFADPSGVTLLTAEAAEAMDAGTPSQAAALASVIFDDLAALRGVTRAIYHHEPLHHNGLLMDFYCHATSPLRRYSDMLVHHQLKVHLGRSSGIYADEFILEPEMLELCAKASELSNKNRVMQKRAVRFWVLSFIRDRTVAASRSGERLRISCLVGKTRRIAASLEHLRGVRWLFASDVYIPEYQITHVVCHNRADALEGATLHCIVVRVDPLLDILDATVVRVEAANAVSTEDAQRCLLPFVDG